MKHFKTMGKTQLLLKKKTSTILAFFFVVASGQIFPQSLNGGKGKQLFGIFKKETAVCSPDVSRPHRHQYTHRSTDQKG